MACKNSEAKSEKQKSEGHFRFNYKSENSKFQNLQEQNTGDNFLEAEPL